MRQRGGGARRPSPKSASWFDPPDHTPKRIFTVVALDEHVLTHRNFRDGQRFVAINVVIGDIRFEIFQALFRMLDIDLGVIGEPSHRFRDKFLGPAREPAIRLATPQSMYAKA